MEGSDHREADRAEQAPRLVVITAPGEKAPRKLLMALAQRSVATVVVGDGPAAMLQLALEPTAAIVICEPAAQVRLQELVAAVRHYYPLTRLWRFDERAGGGSALTPIRDETTAIESRRSPAQTHTDHAQPHTKTPQTIAMNESPLSGQADRLRPSSQARHTPGRKPPQPVSADQDDQTPLVSAEELAMLLGSHDDG